MKSEDICL